jgi:hypothetical protein
MYAMVRKVVTREDFRPHGRAVLGEAEIAVKHERLPWFELLALGTVIREPESSQGRS